MVKPGYKQTEIGVIPDEWNVCQLGSITQFHDRKRIPIKESDRLKMQGDYPYYGASGIIDYVNDYIFDGDYILLGEDGANIIDRSSRLAFVVSGKCWINNHAHVIEPHENMDIHFLSEYLESISYDEYNTGTAQPKLNREKCNTIPVPVPPLPEQVCIAEYLRDCDCLITTIVREISKKKAIKHGAMQELLTGKKRLPGFSGTWIHTRIGTMTEVYSGGTPNTAEPSFWGGTIPWMNSGELNLKIVRHVEGRITKAGMDSSSTHYIPAECILIGLAGQGKTRGTAAFNTFSLCTNQSIAAIYPNPDLFDSKFMYYMMDTQYEKLRELSSGDGGRGGLNKKLILDYEVIIPQNVREQAAIAEVLTEMDNEIENLEEKLAKYRQFKQGMMQQLLTGKIRLV